MTEIVEEYEEYEEYEEEVEEIIDEVSKYLLTAVTPKESFYLMCMTYLNHSSLFFTVKVIKT